MIGVKSLCQTAERIKLLLLLVSFALVFLSVGYFMLSTTAENYWHLGDYSHHLANIFFMSKSGFHWVVPNFNFGYDNILFLFYPPLHASIGSAIFSTVGFGSVLYSLKLSSVLVFLLSALIGLVSVYINRSIFKNFKYAFVFYAFCIFNFISLGVFLKIGRSGEFLAVNIFVFLFLTIFKAVERGAINKFDTIKLVAVSPFLMLAHPGTFIFFAILSMSALLLSKIKKGFCF